jgi:hypothetical protein
MMRLLVGQDLRQCVEASRVDQLKRVAIGGQMAEHHALDGDGCRRDGALSHDARHQPEQQPAEAA